MKETATDESSDAETTKSSDEEATEEEEKSDDKSAEAQWANADEITDEILEQATIVKFTAIPTEKDASSRSSFQIQARGDGQLYVRIDKGVRASSGYELARGLPQRHFRSRAAAGIEIQGDGGLLALSGERKLSIQLARRAGDQIRNRSRRSPIRSIIWLARRKVNSRPRNSSIASFDQDNISRIAREDQPINLQNKWKANYSAFDFSQYLQKPADGGSERGLFFLKASGWDPATKKYIKSASTTRFILVSDLGLLVKKNADHSSDVFVASIKTGQPVAGVTVELLGRNGIAVQSGRLHPTVASAFTSVDKNEHEKKPVVYVARLGDDVSFIPYARDDRMLNFSRFDVEGVDERPRGKPRCFRLHRARRLSTRR